MGNIHLLRREVRCSLNRYGFPLPPFLLADLASKFGESPLVVRTIEEVEHENRRKVRWEPWEEAFLEANPHLSDQEIGLILGRSVESVKGKRLLMRRRLNERCCLQGSGAEVS